MSQHLADNSRMAAEEKLNIPEEAEVFVFPASFAQARLWFLDRLFPGNPFYNVSAALTLTGSLNTAALEQTFNEIVRRHEALRTTFMMLEEQLVQVITPTLTLPLPVLDLRILPAAEQETEIRRIATEARSHPFDLSSEPLLRVMLLQLDSSEQILLLNLHHIICDGWSIGVLIRELGTLYTAFCHNQRSPLPDLPIQYADFAHWQREWLQEVGATHESPLQGEDEHKASPLQGEDEHKTSPLQVQLAYWKQQLDNLPVLNLPTVRPRPATPTYQGARQFLELPKSLSEELKALSQRQGVTLFMTLLAAFQTLLYRYTQQEDIVVGSAIANRNRGEIEGLIGFFVNSLVLRTDLSGNPTFVELLERVREVAFGAYAHQDLPFEKLVEELHPERNLSHHPLFQVVFSLQNTPIQALALPGLTLSPLDFEHPSAKFDLEFHLWESPEGLRGQVIYSRDLWDDTTITRMLGHFQILLQGIIVNPQQCLCELPILTQAEQHQLLVDFNQNSSPIKSCFHQLFQQQVEQTPDAIALVFEDEQLTYHELNNRSNQLAHHLQKLGVEPDVLVGICLERSVEMIVGLLGILKAGGVYVPFDPTYPQERLNFMLEDSQVSILLTHSLLAPFFRKGWGERTTCSEQPHQSSVICLDKEANVIQKESQDNAINSITPDNLAYVIYTSGSTGKPKGVLIEHRGLSNLCQAQIKVFNLQPGNRILQFASLSFDASIFEIVMALQTGATLYLAKKESLLPGQNLIYLLRDKAITHVTIPPSVLAVLPTSKLPALQIIISAGEACSMDIVKCWASSRKFFNAYGPTEATVWSTVAELIDNSEKPSIGRPITNTQVYILDSHLQPVPIGIPGELYIGGEGVARGYLHQPELTAVAFIANPFVDRRLSSHERLYKTGDLARYQPDGNIEFLGRMDAQVKIRGFRIELGEIEAQLKQHPAVQEVVVMAKEDQASHKRLVAYISLNKEPSVRIETADLATVLRCFLKAKLPDYMIPSAFFILDNLPLLPNGKVDRNTLKDLNTDKTEVAEKYAAPRTPIEEAIAKIWATLLNDERVGIHDNFFELGGDSLLAVRLMVQIHQQFEREIPLSTLFLNPTIEGLANTLAQPTDSGSWSPLVPIQPSGSKPPFFCVHPILGVVFPYYELAYALGFDQPFYGLQPLGLDGEQSPFTRIEEMAAHYIEALRQVQPSGPYFLGGWSFGGLVAFEMAQQLLNSGHQVALLAIFDTLAPIPGNLPSLGDSLKFMFTAGARYIGSFLLDYFYLITTPIQPQAKHSPFHLANINKLLHGLRNHQAWQSILGEAVLANALPEPSRKQILSELNIRPMMRIYQANNQATLSYVPQDYPNSITLLKTSAHSSKAHQDSSLGWSQLTEGRVEIHQVPGNHLTMLRKPHVKVLANQLKVCIEQARIANTNSL